MFCFIYIVTLFGEVLFFVAHLCAVVSQKQNTLNPKWNEILRLELKHSKPEYLEIVVYDHDAIGKDETLGAVVLPLNDLVQGLEKEFWVKLQGVKTGEIHIGLTAVNFGYPPGSFSAYDPKTLDINNKIVPAYAPKGFKIVDGQLEIDKKHK
jgi:hypothetical protein